MVLSHVVPIGLTPNGTSEPFVRELCGNAFQKTPITTGGRARRCAAFCGFYRQESAAVGARRGLITQRTAVQIRPPQPTKTRGYGRTRNPFWVSLGFQPKGRVPGLAVCCSVPRRAVARPEQWRSPDIPLKGRVYRAGHGARWVPER